ncbi:MAG TPA: DHA2 family efflux MFS transporter permease subunit [bacterium]|nr:DHA2 family efflux MFS transporter permease subunit [bacterium]
MNKWIVTASVLVGALMSAIDTSVVNVALVHVKATYGVTTQQVSWVSTAYLITLAIVMPLTAWLSSVLGRRRMYLSAIALFTAASVLCGLSRTLGQLIAFRILQGLGGGVLQPTSQAIMRETFPPEQQGQAMGFFGMIVLLGPALGPLLGGWLTDAYSWPWIFFINLPVGIVASIMGWQFIKDPAYMLRRGFQRIDGIGIGLMAVGLVALLTLLEEGETNGWFGSTFITGSAVIAAVSLLAFVLWELRVPAPAVNLRILRNLSFSSGIFIGGVLGVALYGSLILLPIFLQNLLGYDATHAGLALMPRGLAMVILMPVAGALYNRLGVYVMIPFGLALSGFAGFMMAHFTQDSSLAQILIPQAIQGAGFAFIFVSLATSALATIPRPHMQSATGLFSLTFQLGGTLGTAIMITLLDHRTTIASANLVRYASAQNPTFVQWWQTYQAGLVARGINPWTAHLQALSVLRQLISHEAAVVAFDYTFAAIATVFLVCLPLVLLIRRGTPLSEERVSAE